MPCSHDLTALVFRPGNRLGLGAAALWYASMGYAVVPIERGGKKPHRMLPATGGVHHATMHPDQIRYWWSLDPAAGIGIATGSPSALAVIDVDVKGRHDGSTSLGGLQFAWGMGPEYPRVRTPSGGSHIWMRIPPGMPVPERPGCAPGIDIKGQGGYVVAPPSCRIVVPSGFDGERTAPIPVPYSWADGCACSVPNATGLFGYWVNSVPAISTSANKPPEDDTPVYDVLVKSGIPRGQRNRVLYLTACSLYRRYGTHPVGAAEVLHKIEAVWQASDKTDFAWRELLVLAESARKFIAQQEAGERLAMDAWLRGGR